MKTTTPRKLLPESWGFLCPVHTPDGSPCGLLNHLAAECKVVTRPPFTEETAGDKVSELARYLVSLGKTLQCQSIAMFRKEHWAKDSLRVGMTPARGHSDGGMVLPYTFLNIMLDGRILGGAPLRVCKDIGETLRQLKVKLLKAGQGSNLPDYVRSYSSLLTSWSLQRAGL